jgi:hypothetical protein
MTDFEKLFSPHAAYVSQSPYFHHQKSAYHASNVHAVAATVFPTNIFDKSVFNTPVPGDMNGLRAMYKQSRAILLTAEGFRHTTRTVKALVCAVDAA